MMYLFVVATMVLIPAFTAAIYSMDRYRETQHRYTTTKHREVYRWRGEGNRYPERSVPRRRFQRHV